MVQLFAMTGFAPPRALAAHPAMVVVGMARVLAMTLIPMLTMRLFPEEQQTRTLEMLLTLPVQETEIVLGKWLGAVSLYLLILAVSLVELALSLLRSEWPAILLTYPALVITAPGSWQRENACPP